MQAEIELYEAIIQTENAEKKANSVDDYMQAFLPLIPSINSFFSEVLVMDENESIRQNRLSLLKRISDYLRGVVDLSHMEGF
jgi:glycyl-tRNA synthetase beta chain